MSVEAKTRKRAPGCSRSVRREASRPVLIQLRPGERALIEGADGEGVEVVANTRGKLEVSDATCGARRPRRWS